jgi:hypothetical protein
MVDDFLLPLLRMGSLIFGACCRQKLGSRLRGNGGIFLTEGEYKRCLPGEGRGLI